MQKKNKRILFICPYPIGEAPSQRFRFEQYLGILEQSDFKFDLSSFWSRKAWERLYTKGNNFTKFLALINGMIKRAVLCLQLPRYDFIFIHREATPLGPPFFEWIAFKLYKKKIIYDFDDAIWIPNTSDVNYLVSKLKWHSKVASICKWSYTISCGNEFLGDFARQYNKRVILNPTTIDSENLHTPTKLFTNKKAKQLIIGWTGTHSTIKYFNPLIPTLELLEEKFAEKVAFMIIADKEPTFKIKSLHFVPWSKKTEIQDLQQFDIGVMPLPDDEWAKGKCGFKALQYLALGIPAIVSPVGVNTSIIENGVNGFIANTPEEWLECLSILINNKNLRTQMGILGRSKIEKSYSVESNTSTFLSLFE